MTVGMVRAKIPYKVVFIFSSTLRFVPLLLEEVQSIIESQRLRGLNFEKMGWLKKSKGLCQGCRTFNLKFTLEITKIRNSFAIKRVFR
jgi:hypothetical protein